MSNRESSSPAIAALRSNRGVGDALSRLQVFALGLGKGDAEWKHKGGGAHALAFRRQPRRGRAVLQGERGAAKAMARHDDCIVGRDEILLGAVLDRTHALLHGSILHGDALDAAKGASSLLGVAIDHVVVILIDDRPEGAWDQRDVDAAAAAHGVEL